MSNFLLTDQVGTLRAVADTSGAIVKRIDYDSFGNIIADSNPSFSVPFGFAGGLHDRDTGLVRFGYRDYSPELGRFVAKDPIDFAGGDTNLYAYVTNDPVNFVDPSGLMHEGFIKQILKYSNKELQKAIKSLTKLLEEHRLEPPSKHHDHEIKIFDDQVRLAKEEAAKRGLSGMGGAAALTGSGKCEDLSQEEAENRTDSWFDWLDPFFMPGYAY